MPRGKMTVMEEIPHGRPLAVDNKAKRAIRHTFEKS